MFLVLRRLLKYPRHTARQENVNDGAPMVLADLPDQRKVILDKSLSQMSTMVRRGGGVTEISQPWEMYCPRTECLPSTGSRNVNGSCILQRESQTVGVGTECDILRGHVPLWC